LIDGCLGLCHSDANALREKQKARCPTFATFSSLNLLLSSPQKKEEEKAASENSGAASGSGGGSGGK
jgi:hypothetical protein